MSSSLEAPIRTRGATARASRAGRRHALRARLALHWLLVLASVSGALASRADDANGDAKSKLVTGRIGAGALTDSRYSGGAGNQTFPVPLMALDIGDFAYVDYWEAGLFVLSNHAKTFGLAVVATPRLGFSSTDGQRLAGMRRRL